MGNIKRLHIIKLLEGLVFYLPVFSLYLIDNGISVKSIIISQVFYSIMSLISEIPTGLIADKIGQKYTVSVGVFFGLVATVLIFLMPSSAGLYLTYAVRGLGGAFLSGSDEALHYESCKIEKKPNYQKAYGKWKSFYEIGFLISTAVSTGLLYFVPNLSYDILFYLSIIAMSLASAISLTLVDVKGEVKDKAKGKDIREVLSESYRLMRDNDTVKVLTLSSMILFTGLYFMKGVYQPLFEDNGVSVFFMGGVLVLGTILNYVVVKYVYILEKYLKFKQILILLYGAMGISYMLMGIFPYPVILIAGYVLLQGLYAAPYPIISDYIHERTSSEIRSTVVSGISLGRQGVKILMRLALGGLVGILSIESTLFVLGFYIILALGVSYWLVARCGCVYKLSHNEKNLINENEYRV